MKKMNLIGKAIAVCLTALLLCLQAGCTSETTAPGGVRSVAERDAIVRAAIKKAEDAVEQDDAFAEALESLRADLQRLYPDEFHDNLDSLDDSYAPPGGLSERDLAMSNYETMLEALEDAVSPTERLNHLNTLEFDYEQIEYESAEQGKVELDEILTRLEDDSLSRSECVEALDRAEEMLRFRYPERFSDGATGGSTEFPLAEDIAELKKGNLEGEARAAVLEDLKAQILAAQKEDPFLVYAFMMGD